jgi:hypothetical protein
LGFSQSITSFWEVITVSWAPWQSNTCSGTIADKKLTTAANQMAQQMAMNPGAMMQPNQDPHKSFVAEAENLEVLEHRYMLDGIEERILANLG